MDVMNISQGALKDMMWCHRKDGTNVPAWCHGVLEMFLSMKPEQCYSIILLQYYTVCADAYVYISLHACICS